MDAEEAGARYETDTKVEAIETEDGTVTGVRINDKRIIADRVRNTGDARIKSEDCCPRGGAATPDDLPIIDTPNDATDGLAVAITVPVGGIMCSPFVATSVRSLVTGRPRRFRSIDILSTGSKTDPPISSATPSPDEGTQRKNEANFRESSLPPDGRIAVCEGTTYPRPPAFMSTATHLNSNGRQ
ncbi:MAG: hypothetical protein ACQET5_12960 [Halobacteriota archaeon]|uniref:hypothetical protein n=1 Tax=Natronomonas sp. TaxID=2184060 RepID=UPI0039771F74